MTTLRVAATPTPVRTHEHRAPTAKPGAPMAISICPVSGQRPTAEKVMSRFSAPLLRPASQP